jgi:nicotinamidase-related amidase
MTKMTKRLRPENSILVVIDIQDKLLVKIPTAAGLVRNTGFLLDAAKLVDVPIRATVQYPKGLGPLTAELSQRLPQPAIEKTSFSCCGAGTFLDEITLLQRPNVVLAGMETHVCVSQTALDLLAAGLHVFLPVDALGARFELDHAAGLRRLEQSGAVPTSAEAVAFEWLGDSSHPQFKAFSQLVISRAAGG